MKNIFLALVMIGVFNTLKAQEIQPSQKVSFNVAGNIGIGTFSHSKISLGGDIEMDVHAGKDIAFTVSGGYQNYAYEYQGIKYNAGYFPLLGGLKINLAPEVYAHGQLGYAVSNVKSITGGRTGGSFTYAPSLGYILNKKLDLSIKLIAIKSFAYRALVARLAYHL